MLDILYAVKKDQKILFFPNIKKLRKKQLIKDVNVTALPSSHFLSSVN